MADKQYVTATGIVQKFGADKPAVTSREVNGSTVYGFTIKTGTQSYVEVTLWPEFAHVAPAIGDGFGVMVDGAYTQSQGGKDGKVYHNISAKRLVIIPAVQPQEREVVNAAPAFGDQAAPAAAPAAAPVASAPSF